MEEKISTKEENSFASGDYSESADIELGAVDALQDLVEAPFDAQDFVPSGDELARKLLGSDPDQCVLVTPDNRYDVELLLDHDRWPEWATAELLALGMSMIARNKAAGALRLARESGGETGEAVLQFELASAEVQRAGQALQDAADRRARQDASIDRDASSGGFDPARGWKRETFPFTEDPDACIKNFGVGVMLGTVSSLAASQAFGIYLIADGILRPERHTQESALAGGILILVFFCPLLVWFSCKLPKYWQGR